MENEKGAETGYGLTSEESGTTSENAPRARNRTVMLTPEITGQVRARLAQEMGDADTSAEESQQGSASHPPQGALVNEQQQSVSSVGHSAAGQDAPPQPAEVWDPPAAGMHAEAVPPQAPEAFSAPQPSEPQAQGNPVVHHQDRPQAAPVSEGVKGGDEIVWEKTSPVVGFLVSFDQDENGTVYTLRSGRLIITSQPANGSNCLLIRDDSVSPMHAIMRITTQGDIQVLDQLSEYGTRITRFGGTEEEELSGDKSSLEHGDVIVFGERTFHVCVLARAEAC